MISKFPRWVWLGGGVLAFSAGMVNAVAFLGVFHQAATHMTGIVSHFSISLYEHQGPQVWATLISLLSFLSGAILSGIIIRDAHLKMGRRYGFALAVESAFLFLSAYAFQHKAVWGGYFACAAAGLQNAMASTYSGAVLRTTHLTGIMTDLGVLIGHKIQGLTIDNRRIKLFLTLIFSFAAGGYAGAVFYGYWGTNAMLVPALMIGLSALGYVGLEKHLKHD